MKRFIIILIIFFWFISITFFFGSISIVGWYADSLFLALTTSSLFMMIKKMRNWLRRMVYGISIMLLIAIAWSTITSVPVERIPKNKKSQEYGYFISRGNLGATSGCYGQVHFFKQVPFFPFLERRIKVIKCSDLPYECYLHDC
jgi:hypothetical protein